MARCSRSGRAAPASPWSRRSTSRLWSCTAQPATTTSRCFSAGVCGPWLPPGGWTRSGWPMLKSGCLRSLGHPLSLALQKFRLGAVGRSSATLPARRPALRGSTARRLGLGAGSPAVCWARVWLGLRARARLPSLRCCWGASYGAVSGGFLAGEQAGLSDRPRLLCDSLL